MWSIKNMITLNMTTLNMTTLNPVTDSVSELAYESIKNWRNEEFTTCEYAVFKVISTHCAYTVLMVVSLIEWLVKVCLGRFAYLFRPRVGNRIFDGAIVSVAISFGSFVALIENIFCKRVGDLVSSLDC
jgi:hypothetical protein